MNQKVMRLIEYIAENAEPKSIFLTPIPAYSVEACGLLDKIADLWQLEKSEVGTILDQTQKKTET